VNAAVEHRDDWQALLRTWQEIDLPDGWKAEIADGGIALTPPPGYGHNDIADLVNKALVRALPEEWGIYHTLAVQIAGEERLYIPDLVVIPRDAPREFKTRALSTHALLAVEITSKGNAATDRTTKRDAYARGGVDAYVLIDAWEEPWPRVTVFSEPSAGGYERSVTRPFGEPVHIPEPIGMDLDTSRFH